MMFLHAAVAAAAAPRVPPAPPEAYTPKRYAPRYYVDFAAPDVAIAIDAILCRRSRYIFLRYLHYNAPSRPCTRPFVYSVAIIFIRAILTPDAYILAFSCRRSSLSVLMLAATRLMSHARLVCVTLVEHVYICRCHAIVTRPVTLMIIRRGAPRRFEPIYYCLP